MSDLLFTCPKCSKHLAIDNKGSGSTIKCPDCNATVNVPHAKAFFKCQACHCDLSAPQGLEGNVFKCPECDVDIVVPKTPKTSGVSEGKVCSKCGNEEPDSSLFCKECGTTLSPKISTQNNKCQNCGNNNESDATFCGECGIALTPSSIPHTGKTCPKCRAKIPTPNAFICMSCGHNLRTVNLSQPPLPVRNELKLKPLVQEGIRLKPNAHKLVYGEQHEIASASCPYCGNPLPAVAAICVHCGTDLRTGKKLRMMTPKAKSNFDFNIAPFLKFVVFCVIIWGCYAGYQAYKGSTSNGASSSTIVFSNTAEDDKLYDYVKAKMSLTSDIGERKNLIDSYMLKYPVGKHSGEMKALAEQNEQSIAQWKEQQKYGDIKVRCFATLGNGNVIPVQGWVQLIESPKTAAAHITAYSDEINELAKEKHKMERLGNMESYIQMNFMSLGRTLCKVRGRAIGGVTLDNGTAVFQGLSPGDYILYGSGRAGATSTGWFQDVNVTGGHITTITPSYFTCSYDETYAWKPYPWGQ